MRAASRKVNRPCIVYPFGTNEEKPAAKIGDD